MPLFAADPVEPAGPMTWVNFGQMLVEAAAFGLLGIALLALGFKVFERITPKLDVEEQLKQGNIAVGIMVGAVLVGISVVVAVVVG